jgi:hypothetical protein
MVDSVEYGTYLPNLDLEKSGLNHALSTGTGTYTCLQMSTLL